MQRRPAGPARSARIALAAPRLTPGLLRTFGSDRGVDFGDGFAKAEGARRFPSVTACWYAVFAGNVTFLAIGGTPGGGAKWSAWRRVSEWVSPTEGTRLRLFEVT
ncbi:ABC transporter transmembrane region [Mycolicibacterium brisbanense]|uniref:ABC transporter transmembrane region n=1 Tax=Mycolicibacterium brisbanense TaxID=146020 RepID=A0A124DZ97_9MYCO|nr:ABC transporter transmembrane region [Mycolicibacterium brisbanense]